MHPWDKMKNQINRAISLADRLGYPGCHVSVIMPSDNTIGYRVMVENDTAVVSSIKRPTFDMAMAHLIDDLKRQLIECDLPTA